MAVRNTRHRQNSLADSVPIRDVQDDQAVSRYDMSLPQNWTVEQLRAELSRNDVPFRKTYKKAKLIQLCRESGLINPQNSDSVDSSNPGHSADSSEISKLTNTVAELQQTVAILSRNMDILVQSRSEPAQKDSSNVTGYVIPDTSGINPLPETQVEFSPAVLGMTTTSQNNTTAAFSGLSNMNERIDTSTTGTRTRFGFAAESLPFIETVHPTLRKQIVEGKDINLAALLIPYYTGYHADSSELVKEKDKPDPRLQNSLTLPQFIQAFGIYKNILCEVHPSRREELDLYERDIVYMASRYGGKGFYEYHRMFSAEAAAHLRYANRKVDWSVRNNKLFTTIFVNQRAYTCNICNSSLHVSAFCTNQLREKGDNSQNSTNKSNKDKRGRTRTSFMGKEICNNFNGQTGCNYNPCRNLHICLTCKKEHPQHTCTVSKNSPTVNGNSKT